MTLVTLFSDASFCPYTRAAGWAAWMRAGDRPPEVFSGRVGLAVTDSNQAELCAVGNGLYHATSRGFVGYGDEILVQCDSQYALQMLLGGIASSRECPATDARIQPGRRPLRYIAPVTPRQGQLERMVLGRLRTMLLEYNATLLVRHVVAHGGVDHPRSWVNDKCDKAARRHMMDWRREKERADAQQE